MWLDMQESPQKLPIPDEKFQLVDFMDDQDDINHRRPSVDELVTEIQGFYSQQRLVDSTWNIVIGGEGEPTLRLSSLILLIQQLRQLQPSCSIRVTTNGLLDQERTNRLLKECCDTGVHFSVALMTHDANQYTEIMRPTQSYSFANVQQFIESTVAAGFQVEVTAVNQPTVNKERTVSMAEALGVTSSVRWREYFP
jgi:TatD family-associated radical SAM protein